MRTLLTAALTAAALVIASGAAMSHEYRLGSLHIGHPWSRATPPNSNVGAGYLELRNDGAAADRLVEARSPASDRVEMHSVEMVDGVMKMRPVVGGVAIDPGATVAFEPGGYHLMLVGLKAPLREGGTVPVELVFENAGTVAVDLAVGPLGAPGADSGHGSH